MVSTQRAADPERIAALRASGLLERDGDARLRTLCEAAAKLLRTPASLLNVVDAERRTTLAGYPSKIEQTTNDDSACTEVVVAAEPLVIPNTLLHPVTCDMSFVVKGGWRAYLGVPIFYDAQAVGSLCVVDVVVREWAYWDVEGLKGVARLAGLSVER